MKTTLLYEDQLAPGTHPCKGKEKLVTELGLRGNASTIAVLDLDVIRSLDVDGFPTPRFTQSSTESDCRCISDKVRSWRQRRSS